MSGDGGSSVAVMADAQLTNVRVLQPFAGFEAKYQGVQALTPIAFPGKLDPRAGQPGYDARLLAGAPVPQGARVQLSIPMCFISDDQSVDPFRFYSYRIVWRYQNLFGFRNPAASGAVPPYHFPRQSPGAPDTSSGVAVPRVTLPGSWHVIAHEESETSGQPTKLNIRQEELIPQLDSLAEFVQPLTPGGIPAVIQQGVADLPPNGAIMPIFVPFWTDAEADEIIILARRVGATADANDVWDFTDPAKDLAFSNIYGTGNGTHQMFRDVGIYLQTGSNP